LLRQIQSIAPDIVGISASTFSFQDAVDLSHRLRAIQPKALVVLGGPHASALPIDSLQRTDVFDACVIGEGEQTLFEIAQGLPPNSITGLVWRDGSGNLVTNISRTPLAELDSVQLDWTLLRGFPQRYQPGWQDRRFGPAASLVATRGCGYSCEFCAGSVIHGRTRRVHSPAYVVDAVRHLFRTYDIRNIYFHDDDFCQDPGWLEALCRGLARSRLPVQWSCAARVENLSKELLHVMRAAGCRQIGVGLETASTALLEWLRKGTTSARLARGIERIHAAGLHSKAYLIIGTPTETLADLMGTVRLLVGLRVAHVQVSYFTPLPGSPAFHRNPVAENKWRLMNLLHPVGEPSLPRSVLRLAELGIYVSCYGRRLVESVVPSMRLQAARRRSDG
jgi:radical SAM superfamily enzyme YgiQ (UPF0313 family)